MRSAQQIIQEAKKSIAEAKSERTVADFPHFHHYAYAAGSQNSGMSKQHAGKTKIPNKVLGHVQKAEKELTGKSHKELHSLGSAADEGEDSGLKHSPKALEHLFY